MAEKAAQFAVGSRRSFARLDQVLAIASQRACTSGELHCSAIARHAACKRRYSSERIVASTECASKRYSCTRLLQCGIYQ